MSDHTSNMLIKTQKLCKNYCQKEFRQHIIRNLDIQIRKNDFTIIMGVSGSGKSTLIHLLSGMDRPTLGEIFFEGDDITKFSEKKLAQFRRMNCGFVFQKVHLINSMSAMDNVLISGMLINKRRKEVLSYAMKLFQQVGLAEQDWEKYPFQLSGGQMGRVGVVRALINHPEIIFADEPTGALDSKSGTAVLDLLTTFNDMGQTTIMVTHDLKSALRGNRILYLRDGQICGECCLEKYVGDDQERKKKLLFFLEEMGW